MPYAIGKPSMECADCETSLDDFMVDQYELGRLDLALCFSCYLARDETAFDYSDYEPSGRFGNHNDVVKTALSQNNEFKIELLIEGYESQGIVLFASTRSDADSLLSTIANSELGDYISQTAVLPLREVYSEEYQQLCWNAANWRYDPYSTARGRGPASVSVVQGIPCIVDGYRYLGDEAESVIFDGLLEEYLSEVDINQLDSLSDARAAAEDCFPIVSELGLSFSIRVEKYFRRNPDLLSTHFATLTSDDSQYVPHKRTSLDELKQLYESGVEEAATAKEEILALLEMAEGAASKDIANVVGCSDSYARRFKYDPEKERAVEKAWSQSAQEEKVSPGTRDRIIRRDGSCLRCNREEELTVHHILPISEGGESCDENLATLCEPCHKEAHGGSYYPPTTEYDGDDGFESWLNQ